MALRTGRTNPHTLYEQLGDEPGNDDLPLGFLSDADLAEEVVDRYNDYPNVVQNGVRLMEQNRELRDQVEHYRQEIQRLQAIKEPVVMSDASKADTEAAFGRGVEHARGNLGVSKYALNRDGLVLLGTAATRLAQVQAELDAAVTALSTDDEATDR